MAKRVADLITDILHAAGVRRIYGVVGDSLNGLTSARVVIGRRSSGKDVPGPFASLVSFSSVLGRLLSMSGLCGKLGITVLPQRGWRCPAMVRRPARRVMAPGSVQYNSAADLCCGLRVRGVAQ